ncbi:MAG: tyrosine--tRNA ligase [Alphaproteobacteria bacterium]|nr:MAG: tyrosine--tRNA ligase [Alphaproteobacteria bacterium]
MANYKSDFMNTLFERGFIHQCTDETALDQALVDGTVTGYIGFDCTATSLHVGSLIQIMMLRHLQKAGHKPIALLGGGTTKVGDPTDKDESRPLLSDEKIAENMAGIRKVFDKLLTFGNKKTDALMVNNDDWLSKLGYVEFLRDYGTHFTINRMLTFDSVKLRLSREQPMTFLEFNYMLMQAFDYHELYNRYGCTLQMGGSDQWGNIVNGVELCRRKDQAQVFGLTTPLLSTASGQKMGKTVGGAVWLNEDMCSPYDYWQYWRNCEDADVGVFLRRFTELPLDEIKRLEALDGQEINEAKKVLANEATTMIHGAEAAAQAAETARQAFEEGLSAAGLPTIEVPATALKDGIWAPELFTAAGLTQSNGEARRQIKGGGLKINDAGLTDDQRQVSEADLNEEGVVKLSFGKKRHVLVKPV